VSTAVGPTPDRTPRTARAQAVVAAARTLLDAEGAEALTMRTLAAQLGVRAPSLYKHLPDKQALEAALVEEALVEMGTALHAACDVRPGGAALGPLLAAYRATARRRPHAYRLATVGHLPRELLPPGLEAWAGAPFVQVADGDEHLARAIWSFAHGMVVLELDGRYPDGADVDAAWAAGLRAFAGQVGGTWATVEAGRPEGATPP